MKIHDLMTTDVSTAELGSTLEEIASMMRHEDVGSIPVIDDNELVGIITDRDIVIRCIAEGRNPAEATAEDILTGNLVTVSPEDEAERAAELMSRHQIRRLPVVKDNHLVGMVSLGDVAVKEEDDTLSAEALEDISEGVKERSQKQPAGSSGRSQRTGKNDQGISNHAASEEKKRQERVVPISSSQRATGAKRNPRRKIS